jgi:hypothetical protein
MLAFREIRLRRSGNNGGGFGSTKRAWSRSRSDGTVS